MYKPRGILNEEVVGIFEYYKRSGNIPEAIINHSLVLNEKCYCSRHIFLDVIALKCGELYPKASWFTQYSISIRAKQRNEVKPAT